MTDVMVASTEADATAATTIEAHHAELAGALDVRVAAVITAAVHGDGANVLAARQALVAWCQHELLPHAAAEEQALYPAAARLDRGRLLVDGMQGEHRAIVGLADELTVAADTVHAAAAARALQVLLVSHLEKENQLLMPLLTGTPGVSLAALLAEMHELLRSTPEPQAPVEAGGCGGHSCSCGESDGPGYPELDARSVPHAIRHATIFGALDSVAPGAGLVLIAPHDPLPLLAQIEQRWAGTFAVDYLERGPEAWRLSFVRSR
jgi:uncharacterized protein (DUF2249 family)/iron-sulfur cluster repair protein YtfE (RIC family)